MSKNQKFITRRESIRQAILAGIIAGIGSGVLSAGSSGGAGGGGVSDHKVLVDGLDTTPGFLNPKLTHTGEFIQNIVNPGGNEQFQISANYAGTLQSVDAIGQAIGVQLALAHPDHKHQLASPITSTVTIIPTTDVVSAILKGFPSGLSDVLQVFDSTSPTQNKMWLFDKSGDLIQRLFNGNLTPRLRMKNDAGTTNQSILWKDSGGIVRLGDLATDIGILIFQVDADWRVHGDNRGQTFSDFASGNVMMLKSSTIIEGVTYTGVQIGGNILGQSVLLSALGPAIVNVQQVPFVFLIAEQKSADPTAIPQGRIYERSDLIPKRLSYSSDGTVAGLQRLGQNGTIELINADETQASITVPNADTNIKTFSLPTNTYSRIESYCDGFINLTSTKATLQTVNLKIKYGATQIGNTMQFQAATAAISKFPFTFKVQAVQTGAVTIAVTGGAAAADANTTIFVNTLKVKGVV